MWPEQLSANQRASKGRALYSPNGVKHQSSQQKIKSLRSGRREVGPKGRNILLSLAKKKLFYTDKADILAALSSNVALYCASPLGDTGESLDSNKSS